MFSLFFTPGRSVSNIENKPGSLAIFADVKIARAIINGWQILSGHINYGIQRLPEICPLCNWITQFIKGYILLMLMIAPGIYHN